MSCSARERDSKFGSMEAQIANPQQNLVPVEERRHIVQTPDDDMVWGCMLEWHELEEMFVKENNCILT
jgi:hypothetical protein